MREHSRDPYEVLQLGHAATAREVARAYRSLVRTLHSDTRAADAVPVDPNSRALELQKIMDAYAVLRDPAQRAAYDRQPWKSPPPESAPPPRDPGPSGPDLIIGPLRWESPMTPAPGRQVLWWIPL